MGKLTFITGGMRSGKSTYGENLLQKKASVLYIATGIVTDDEMAKRVEIHQQRRGERYTTYEGYKNLDDVIKNCSNECIMLECIGTMITNLMFDRYYEYDELNNDQIVELEEYIIMEIDKLLMSIDAFKGEVVIISNEVGFALISEYKLGRIYTDILGRVNQRIAKKADTAIVVVSGLPLILK